jgi:hypothetical protein
VTAAGALVLFFLLCAFALVALVVRERLVRRGARGQR